jgi:transposase
MLFLTGLSPHAGISTTILLQNERSKQSLIDSKNHLMYFRGDIPNGSIKRSDKSMTNFFKGFGYPRFKGRNRYNSFTYPQNGFSIKDGKLHLSKIGNIKIILHQEIEEPTPVKINTKLHEPLHSLVPDRLLKEQNLFNR